MSPLSIGIACYPTFGGSGIIATEVGLALAKRGYRVHFLCTELPRRLDPNLPNIWFHPVVARDYPLFPQAPYSLALASQMVQVARSEGLDVLHAHYAVPHATSAWMAREVLGAGAPRLVTTLHGTDITLVGSDPAYLPITRHSIACADALSAPSAYLRDETWRRFDLDPATTPIEVIPNFVDTDTYRPGAGDPPVPGDGPVLVHTSNFRPVKRVDWVVEVFARVVAETPARLLLIGDGPDRPKVEAALTTRGLRHRVAFAGLQSDVASLLRGCAVFLLPSETESFGLAALEALATGVPVVATAVGGVPEAVRHGQTGFLVDDLDEMVAATLRLVRDAGLRHAMGAAARADAVARFQPGPQVDRYVALYERALG